MDQPEEAKSAGPDDSQMTPPETVADSTQEATSDVNQSDIAAEFSSVIEGGGDANSDPIPDTRLYVPDNEDWEVHIKRDSDRLYCYSKHPGQDWFHLLLNGEIYVSRQHEKYCLRCALRMGFLTEDRLFWQHRVPKKRNRITPL